MGIAVKYKNRRSLKIAHILTIVNGVGGLPEHEGSVNIWVKATKSCMSGHFKCS